MAPVLNSGNWKLETEIGNWEKEIGNWKPKLEAANWPCRRQVGPNKPNAANGFDINAIRGKGTKQTQWCYPQLYQYVTGISALILQKHK